MLYVQTDTWRTHWAIIGNGSGNMILQQVDEENTWLRRNMWSCISPQYSSAHVVVFVFKDKWVVFKDKWIVFKDKWIVFKDKWIVFKDNSFVFKDNSFVFKDSSFVFKDHSFVFKDK